MDRTSGAGRTRRRAPKSPAARVAWGIAAVVELTAKVVMLKEVSQRPREDLRGPRWAWVLAAFVNTLGPLAWFAWGRRQHPASRPQGTSAE